MRTAEKIGDGVLLKHGMRGNIRAKGKSFKNCE